MHGADRARCATGGPLRGLAGRPYPNHSGRSSRVDGRGSASSRRIPRVGRSADRLAQIGAEAGEAAPSGDVIVLCAWIEARHILRADHAVLAEIEEMGP